MSAAAISLLESGAGTVSSRVAVGLYKIGLALKKRSWRQHEGPGLAPLQTQILGFLRLYPDKSAKVSTIARELAVSMPTISEAVDTLQRKRLVLKAKVGSDRRLVMVRLSASGARRAIALPRWPDILAAATDQLSLPEQVVLLRAVVKLIKTMQMRGDIPVARLCVTCRFFRPQVYDNAERPHHCDFVDAPFGDRSLRVDCPEHQPASPGYAAHAWTVFIQPHR